MVVPSSEVGSSWLLHRSNSSDVTSDSTPDEGISEPELSTCEICSRSRQHGLVSGQRGELPVGKVIIKGIKNLLDLRERRVALKHSGHGRERNLLISSTSFEDG